MPTSKRSNWVVGLVAFVTAVAIAVGVTLFLVKDDTSPVKPAPTASKAVPSNKAPESPKSEPREAFDRLTLPLLKGWEPMSSAGDPEEAVMFVDARDCDQSSATCPSLHAYNLQASYFSSADGGTKPFQPLLSECGVNDPALTSTITIDGEKTLYYDIDCKKNAADIHVWVVPSKHTEFAAYEGGGGDLDTKAVKAMVESVTWK